MLRPQNLFLAQFGPDLELIRSSLREVTLNAGQVLSEPGERIRSIYFLLSGLVSKLAVFEDGTEIECALIGREGAVGVFSALGLDTAVTRDVCHLRARALMMEPAALRQVARVSEGIHEALDCYCVRLAAYAIRNGACNARHPVEPRLCRWLLTCSDVLGKAEINLPQEVFAKMLGVQRTSVNPILQRLRARGWIEVGRSRVVLVDRDRLEDSACECYQAMKLSAAVPCHADSAERALVSVPWWTDSAVR